MRIGGSVLRFNAFGLRYFLRAPWHEPMFSERNRAGHKVLLRLLGWRVTVRKASDGVTL